MARKYREKKRIEQILKSMENNVNDNFVCVLCMMMMMMMYDINVYNV